MISIHKDKNGQWDFGISAGIAFLTLEEMKEFDREWARKALTILRKAQENVK